LNCRFYFSVVNLALIAPFIAARAAELNAVGYANVPYGEGYALIANPFCYKENRVDQVLPSAVEGTQLDKSDGGNWVTNEVIGGFWTMPGMPLSPGEAALLRSPIAWVQTWVGSLQQGELKVLIPHGGSLRSSPVPQAGKLSEVLQFPKVPGTKIMKVDGTTGQWVLRATCTEAGWDPEEPVLSVGEGFYVEAPREFVWSRTFAVNGESPAAAAIIIVAQPQSRQINLGDTVSLSVEAASTNRLAYQWQLNGNDIPGATDPTLVIPGAGRENAGTYWVKIWDLKSWVWSAAAKVELAPAASPRLTITPDSGGRGVILVFEGTAGRAAGVEVSPDLIHWSDLRNGQPIDANSVLDQMWGWQMRFYRLRLD